MARDIKGYIVAVVCFSALHLAITLVSNTLDSPSLERAMIWLNSSALVLYAIAGFIASAIAKRRYVLNGLIAGLLAAIAALFLFGVAMFDPIGTLITLAIGAVFGTAGGAIALVVTGRGKEAL